MPCVVMVVVLVLLLSCVMVVCLLLCSFMELLQDVVFYNSRISIGSGWLCCHSLLKKCYCHVKYPQGGM